MKRLLCCLLLIIVLFAGCTPEESTVAVTEYNYSGIESDMFPFYCVGEDDMLWRVEHNRAYLVKYKVNYSFGGTEHSFIRYFAEDDTVIFATDITVENGVKLCNIGVYEGEGEAQIIAMQVLLDSLRVNDGGNLLFIDSADTLFFRRNGIIIKIEDEVAQAEFAGDDTFLFRMKNGTNTDGEFSYPIYVATAEYRNHLMDALSIAAADSENGKAYIIKDKHTVQKRAAFVEVAHCYVYADGEILFDIPSVVLSQFEENKHIFLISCNENEPTLKYNLYRIDGGVPKLKASGITAGRYISADRSVFAYETVTEAGVKTSITDYTERVLSFSLDCSLESLYYCAPYTYVFSSGMLSVLNDDGTTLPVDSGIERVTVINNRLLCYKGRSKPYGVYACNGSTITMLASNVSGGECVYTDRGFFYLGDANELFMVDVGGRKTALLSNIDVKIGLLAVNATVAAARSDDKSLYIMGMTGITNTRLKIKRFVKDSEIV